MVTEWVIAGFAEEHVGGPGAPRAALVRVVAGAAEPPEIFHRAIARVPQRRGALPDVLQRILADVAAGPAVGRQRGTTLDGPVRLDAERRASGAARREVAERHLSPQQ